MFLIRKVFGPILKLSKLFHYFSTGTIFKLSQRGHSSWCNTTMFHRQTDTLHKHEAIRDRI